MLLNSSGSSVLICSELEGHFLVYSFVLPEDRESLTWQIRRGMMDDDVAGLEGQFQSRN